MALDNRNINLDVTVTAHTEGANKASRALSDVEREADKTGKSMRGMSGDAKLLNEEIAKSSAKLKELERAFVATGGSDTQLRRAVQRERSSLNELNRVAKDLEPEFKKTGELLAGTVANSFTNQLGSAFSGEGGIGGMGAAVAAIGTLIAVAAAPLGAILAGAVVGAAGTGGLVGGVLAAAHDPQVKTAFESFADTAKSTFFGAGESFVEPVVEGLQSLGSTVKGLGLDKTFAAIAPTLPVIIGGIEALVTNLLPGLNTLFARAGPFADAAAGGFADAGSALAEFLDNVSASPGAIEGITTLFAYLDGTIKALGVSLRFLSDRYHEFTAFQGAVANGVDQATHAVGLHIPFLDRMADNLLALNGRTNDATHAQFAYSAALDTTASDAKKVNDALAKQGEELQTVINLINETVNTLLAVDNAQLGVSKGWHDLSNAIAENGKHWNDNTDAAIKNRQAVLDQIGNLERTREAEIKNGESVADAAAEYAAGVQKVLDFAGALGATKAQLDEIAHKYVIEVELQSSLPAIGQAIAQQFQGALLRGGGLATGGSAMPGYSYTVGETQMERLDMLPGGGAKVTPIGPRAAGGGSGQPVVINFNIPPGDGLGQAVVAYLAKFAHNVAGGNVQLAITGRTG